MEKSINDHEDRHMAIYKAAMTGLAQKLKDLKPAPGKKKLTDAEVRKVYDDAFCGAQKKQDELDAREGTIAVNPDEKGFTVKGAKHDYTTGCRTPAAGP
jgi:predicted secreted Zn-dependent protease